MHAEAERLRARAQPAGDATGAESVAVAGHEQRILARRGEAGAQLQPMAQGVDRLAAHRYGALALAFAGDGDEPLGEVEPGIDVDSGEFRNPKP